MWKFVLQLNFLIEEGVDGTKKSRDMMLFRDGIDLNNDEMKAAILEYLNPDNESYLKLEYRGVCLIGYDETSYPSTPNSKTEQDILNEVNNQIANWNSMLSTRLINRTPMDSFILEIFIVPFSSVEEFRSKFLESIK